MESKGIQERQHKYRLTNGAGVSSPVFSPILWRRGLLIQAFAKGSKGRSVRLDLDVHHFFKNFSVEKMGTLFIIEE
jgi:hypothetical protein